MRLSVGWSSFLAALHVVLGYIEMPTNSDLVVHETVDDTEPFPGYSVGIEMRLNPTMPGMPHCAGVALTSKLVLTACKQCLREEEKVYITDEIYVHVSYKNHRDPEVEILKAEIVMRHPNCYNHRFEYWPSSDVGLIKLGVKMKLKKRFFAYLPRDTFKFPMENRVYLTNYRHSNVAALTMREATWAIKVLVQQLHLCAKTLNFTSPCHNFYCTSYYHTGAPYCQSDIGSPLSVYFKKRKIFVAIGLLIYKVACGCHRSPGIFVMTQHVREWIMVTARSLKQNVLLIGD